MKLISRFGILTTFVVGGVLQSQAAISLSGSALVDTESLEGGQKGVLLADVDGIGFSSLIGNIGSNLSISDSATYSGTWGDFESLATNTSIDGGSEIAMPGTLSAYTFKGEVSPSDKFAILVYDQSSTVTLPGDSFLIWSADDWTLPSDGETKTFGTDLTQLSSGDSPLVSGNVIPEPSAYAAIAGLTGLAYVLARRRRRSSLFTNN